MKTLALILTAALLAAGCNILSESSSNHEGDNYSVGDDGTVTVDVAAGGETNLPEAIYLELVDAGRIFAGVLLPSDDELTEGIYNESK
jgi:hypothetical protein|tara:strand:+ start:136 stop:399 length:264 start_codon:yes stop_codon:yes gene_type:complete